MPEDPTLELAELGARLEAQVMGECPPYRLKRGERIDLAAAAVEREHQLADEALAARVLADELLELRYEPRSHPGLELGIDAPLEHEEPLLLEPRDLSVREGLVAEVGERWPSPEGQRLPELRRCHEGLEAFEIELTGLNPE